MEIKTVSIIAILMGLILPVAYIVSEFINAKRKTRTTLACLAIAAGFICPGCIYNQLSLDKHSSNAKNNTPNKIISCRMDPKRMYKCFLAESHWLPSESIVKKAEPVVIEYIKQKDPNILRKLPEYRCQYMGIIKKGKKLLFCNFLLYRGEKDLFTKDWKNRIVWVLDGGECFFQIEYDIELKKCISFSVNGEA